MELKKIENALILASNFFAIRSKPARIVNFTRAGMQKR